MDFPSEVRISLKTQQKVFSGNTFQNRRNKRNGTHRAWLSRDDCRNTNETTGPAKAENGLLTRRFSPHQLHQTFVNEVHIICRSSLLEKFRVRCISANDTPPSEIDLRIPGRERKSLSMACENY